MKKTLVAIATIITVVVGWFSFASAHHLNITGTSSCVRADGTWDWNANYTIPNEPWANGLTVSVTWQPGKSGTSSADFVDVTANGAWSNGNHGGGATRIYKGQPCPVETTTTTIPEETTTSVSETSTTSSTIPDTSTTVVTTTTVPVTQVSTTSVPPINITVPVETQENSAPEIPGRNPPQENPTELPATGAEIWVILILGVVVIILGIKLMRVGRRK